MITRFAFFEGHVAPERAAEFRKAVIEELVPTWQVFPGASAVRVTFATERDEGAPEMPMMLAVDYPDRAALERALASQERIDSRAATQRVLPRFGSFRIHHHITDAESFPAL
ncbi:MAG: hypothetical protein KDK26_04165 [Roseivivax sp.]|nr:hypothetical protein [Roseivivax sp.]